MPEIPIFLRRLAATVAWAILAAAMLAPAAGAAEFGELERHPGGTKGKEGELKVDGETAGLGVDPSDNSVYVVDQPKKAGSQFRIQKFSSDNGKLTFVASYSFETEDGEVVEGVAVDPKMHRVYVLATQEREEQKKVKELDEGDEAASQLFAFSTVQKGTALEPAAGTGAEGLLAGSSVLKPQGSNLSEVLLEPHGIAVEPISESEDTVVLLGTQDVGGAPEADRNELWFLSSKGTLTKKWTDEANALEDEATSLVAFDEKIYVEGEEGSIWEIPSTLGPAKPFTRATAQEQTFFEAEGLVDLPTVQSPEYGAGLAVSPEGTASVPAGTIWQTASVHLASGGDKIYPGVASYNPSGEFVGWTGGASPASGAACSIGLYGPPLIAAGKEGDLFVLGITVNGSGQEEDALIEFGPGGSGCPEASATTPVASVGGKVVEPSQPIPIGDSVALSSSVTQGNVIKTEWNFGDGTPTQTVNGIQQCYELAETEGTECAPQTTFVEHTFAKAGKLEVTEKITTDDLAKPVVEQHATVLIEASPPTATTGEANPVGEETATLNGSVDGNGTTTTWTKCEFVYGTTTSYGKSASCEPAPGSSAGVVKVSAQLKSLEKEKTYDYKLIATYSSEGKQTTVEGANRTFTPGLKAPTATTEAATAISQSAATLNASVNAEGNTISSCKFEYGATAGYSASAECSTKPAGKETVHVSAGLTGLAAGTAYHFRIVVATSAGKTVDGAEASFKTEAGSVVTPPGETPSTPSTPSTTTPSTTTTPSPSVGVLSYTSAKVALTGASTVASSGAFTVKLTCPAGAGSCSGTVSLKTAKAVKASAHQKASIMTLTSGSFTIAAGQTKTVTLHLSSKARSLLAKLHAIPAKASVVAHNKVGASTTNTLTLTLKPAKKKH